MRWLAIVILGAALAGCGKKEEAPVCLDDLTIVLIDEGQRTTLFDQEVGGKHFRFQKNGVLGAVGDRISLCERAQ